MGDDCRELANHLFATATAMLEDAYQLAAAGQSPRLSLSELVDHGHRLQVAVRDIATIAEAAVIAAKRGVNEGGNRPKD